MLLLNSLLHTLLLLLLTGLSSCSAAPLLLGEQEPESLPHLRIVAGHRGTAGVPVTEHLAVATRALLVIARARPGARVFWIRIVRHLIGTLTLIVMNGGGRFGLFGSIFFFLIFITFMSHHFLQLLSIWIVMFVITCNWSLIKRFHRSSFFVFICLRGRSRSGRC